MIAACGAFALTGFPLDDMWHRLFGQDVTLWGPTHLMLIGGGSLATLGGMVLMAEAMAAPAATPSARPAVGSTTCAARCSSAASSSRYPPSRASSTSACRSSALVLHPILIMLAAGIGLVTARALPRARRRAAGGGRLPGDPWLPGDHGRRRLGPDHPHFPLYIVEALLVEAVFLRATAPQPGGGRRARRRC